MKRSSLLLFPLILTTCIGCSNNQKKKNNTSNSFVFGASAMQKYEQQSEFNKEEVSKEINISAAKNEYEPAQIIISANDEEINNYNVEASDLTSADGNIIAKGNIFLYSAYYNSITNSLNGYPAGYYPDILIPLKDRIAYGDNKVAKNEIQSIWFSIYVPNDTKSGEYSGNFKVTFNDKTEEIHVKLNVYDFTLPEETHAKTAFAIWGPTYGNDMLSVIYGKKAKAAENSYYEFLLKYRVAGTSLPNIDLSTVNNWIEQAVEYASRKDVPCFTLPFRIVDNDKYAESRWFDETFMHDVLCGLVDKSTSSFNLFDKVYAYGIVDEPDYTNQVDKAKDYTETLKNIINQVLSEKDFTGKENVKEGLKNLRIIITLCDWDHDVLNELGDQISCYCPKFYLFDKEDNVNEFVELAKKGVGIWAYGCNIPGWPYPTYQVDADLFSPRSVGILQMKYNIEGNLFWCANVGRIYNGSQYTDVWDPYKTAYAFAAYPGDGYVVVQAGKYNTKTINPYPTMRLEMIREGQEDYEYLYMLKDLVAKKGETAIKALEEKLNNEYNKVFDGAKPTEDPSNMEAFKGTIANLILENK